VAVGQRVPARHALGRPRFQLWDARAEDVGYLLGADLALADDEALAGSSGEGGGQDVGFCEVLFVVVKALFFFLATSRGGNWGGGIGQVGGEGSRGGGMGAYSDVCVDGHSIWRQIGGRRGVDEEAIDPRVGLVEIFGGFYGVAEGAVDHGWSESHEVEIGFLVLHEVPCCDAQSAWISHGNHMGRERHTGLLGELLAGLVGCVGGPGEGLF
jgi:hypothetical protein